MPNPLELSALVNETESGSLTFENTGDATLSYTVIESASWLELTSGASGTVAAGTPVGINVRADCSGRASEFKTTLTIESNDPDQPSVPVAVILDCNEVPSDSGNDGRFAIQLRFVDNGLSNSQKAIFQQAANRWAEVITNDLADIANLQLPAYCAPDYPAYSGPVDDVLIDVAAPNMDGQYGMLGRAGPCYTRNANSLPVYGVMEFDQADLDWLEQEGRLEDTILHEMGHVLGIGTLWEYLGLLQHNGGSGGCEYATEIGYTGGHGKAEYASMGGSGNVPVEDGGGGGTKCGHWDEETFQQELMTGWLNGDTVNPLSRLTVGSLDDMGYEVDYRVADSYSFSTLAPLDIDEQHKLEEILIRPRFELEPSSGN